MYVSQTQVARQRLGSVGDSAPPSDSSETSNLDTFEIVPEWALDSSNTDNLNNELEMNDNNLDLENNGVLLDTERAQVETFFSGLGTEIFVCPSLANLYESIGTDDWRLIYTGIPVLLHDKGSARSRTIPRVTFVLAERGTCFALWKDTIDHLSDYKAPLGQTFHTMHLSNDHTKIIGFSFDSVRGAREVWNCIDKLISNPENISLSVPGKKRKQPKRSKPPPLPPKTQISRPCQFHHVTSVTTDDTQRYYSLKAFVLPPVKNRD